MDDVEARAWPQDLASVASFEHPHLLILEDARKVAPGVEDANDTNATWHFLIEDEVHPETRDRCHAKPFESFILDGIGASQAGRLCELGEGLLALVQETKGGLQIRLFRQEARLLDQVLSSSSTPKNPSRHPPCV